MSDVRSGRLAWIDFAKAAAILAVIVDHMKGSLYTSERIWVASHYSVSLFILVAGVTSWMSHLRHRDEPFDAYLRRTCGPLVSAYVVATALYLVCSNRFFNLEMYLDALVHFNASGPLYYVLLYVQLMVAGRVLLGVLEGLTSVWQEACVLAVVCSIASVSNLHTSILDVYGGGGKLLGGSYLILYYLGMLAARHGVAEEQPTKAYALAAMMGFAGYLSTWIHYCRAGRDLDLLMPLGGGVQSALSHAYAHGGLADGGDMGHLWFIGSLRHGKSHARCTLLARETYAANIPLSSAGILAALLAWGGKCRRVGTKAAFPHRHGNLTDMYPCYSKRRIAYTLVVCAWNPSRGGCDVVGPLSLR